MALSSAKILLHSGSDVLSWTSFPNGNGENAKLIDLLFYYFKLIGVSEYEEYNDGIIWQLDGVWYSQDQIDRIVDLKVFK